MVKENDLNLLLKERDEFIYDLINKSSDTGKIIIFPPKYADEIRQIINEYGEPFSHLVIAVYYTNDDSYGSTKYFTRPKVWAIRLNFNPERWGATMLKSILNHELSHIAEERRDIIQSGDVIKKLSQYPVEIGKVESETEAESILRDLPSRLKLVEEQGIGAYYGTVGWKSKGGEEPKLDPEKVEILKNRLRTDYEILTGKKDFEKLPLSEIIKSLRNVPKTELYKKMQKYYEALPPEKKEELKRGVEEAKKEFQEIESTKELHRK